MPKVDGVKWKVGDFISIPLKDGDECLALIAGRKPGLLNSINLVMFDRKGKWGGGGVPVVVGDDVFSVLDVTRDLADSGRWAIVGRVEDLQRCAFVLTGSTVKNGGVGSKVIGSGIVEEFVNAFYGLAPWDDWYKPDYLDGFLVVPEKKPVDRIVRSGRYPL